ncbi:MAG: bacterial transcriptional activator domain-containing protein [Nocardioidaceae bacterium]
MLTLRPAGTDRSTVEELLWPDLTRQRASANLRSVIWRIRRAGMPDVLESSRTRVRLHGSVVSDVGEQTLRVHALLADEGAAPEVVPRVDRLALDLLPGWCDDWLVLSREQWDQTRLHGLESLARWHRGRRDYLAALDAAIYAVDLEPYRESAQRVLIEIHIAEGNFAAAIRQYQRFRGTVQRELGVSPTPQLTRLVHPVTHA